MCIRDSSQGMRVGLIGANFLGPVVIVVIVTTIVTPILQKIVYNNSPKPEIVHNEMCIRDRSSSSAVAGRKTAASTRWWLPLW